ncbi:iron-sulfur cluster biosynthesis family protein [Cytobacillus sp. OWB-43]|uniref:iron-sulfur cluster biosynthesis family protein n=1 Tax=Cytobacillus sp. OWB-43 TaxID=3108468 RepID=UPI002AFDDEA9|nr:iron-sulfur cluster biosynthesis family protein [Cytobacillus sp. OWB-43]MEA1852979.1 iron-sulfur cluster biosynthesis family protein [Cytobacillus sp. OWB-43]
MKITITPRAIMKLTEKIKNKDGYLKLKYDTEGCGCVVSGVTALWLVKELEPDDSEVQTDFMSIYIEPSKEVFLSEEVTIDYSDKARCFQLKNNYEYLNPRMAFMDYTK